MKHMYHDLRTMEATVKNSPLNWTIIRPPLLTDGPETGNYRIDVNAFLKNCLKISRADVAHFIIHNITNENTFKSMIEISY
ncbi:MAG TPA: NAD(P)-binding oxidoreductase [Mucilaginibacter sp.]